MVLFIIVAPPLVIPFESIVSVMRENYVWVGREVNVGLKIEAQPSSYSAFSKAEGMEVCWLLSVLPTSAASAAGLFSAAVHCVPYSLEAECH